MPLLLTSLLHRTRAGILVLLLVVLPLQGVMPLVAGLQGHRHVHTASTPAVASPSPLRWLLDRLHTAQDARFQRPRVAMAGELHAHGDVVHRHSQDTADVVDVGDAADDAAQGGTAFLAWLPAAPSLAAVAMGSARPSAPGPDWRDRIVAPPLTPPRG